MDLKKEYEAIDENASVKQVQKYVDNMVIDRGFEDEDIKDLMILLTEETGELAKAIRKTVGLKMDISKDNDKFDIKGEIADVFNYLLCMCSKLNIDLLECWLDKEKINLERKWK